MPGDIRFWGKADLEGRDRACPLLTRCGRFVLAFELRRRAVCKRIRSVLLELGHSPNAGVYAKHPWSRVLEQHHGSRMGCAASCDQ
jgi:hypothetical protein